VQDRGCLLVYIDSMTVISRPVVFTSDISRYCCF
jgi:hypothetical protein